MSALSAAGGYDEIPGGPTIHVRVTEPSKSPEFVQYLERLGLGVLAGPDGSVGIRVWDDVEWAEARLELAMAIDSWVRNHGVAVQLG